MTRRHLAALHATVAAPFAATGRALFAVVLVVAAGLWLLADRVTN